MGGAPDAARFVVANRAVLVSVMVVASPHVAFGSRGVAKLVESLSQPKEIANLAVNLATLNSQLSNQESKMQALANDGAVLAVLTKLLESPDADVREQTALAISSLTLVFQGRLAATDSGALAALGTALADANASVRAASAKALESVSMSRDGCSAMAAPASGSLVRKLTAALDDAHKPVVVGSIAALANLLRLDLGVDEALAAKIVPKLAKLVDPSQRDRKLLETGLQALWNLSNAPQGKQGSILDGVLDVLPQHVKQGQPNVRRLAAGCIMAITINKDGKLQSLPCADALMQLLIDPDSDAATVRDAVGALKNMTEYPKVRKFVDQWAKQHNVGEKMQDMFDRVMYDAMPWPSSHRYQHQNVAPGGVAAEEEARLRATWGYPQPFSEGM